MSECIRGVQLSDSQLDIKRNIAVHDRIARKYDARHGEIFNDVEQGRLRAALSNALSLVETGSPTLTALDVGCGSGNLSRHLLDLGLQVVAADVSQGFLDLVGHRFSGKPIKTIRLNGRDLSNVPSASCDVVAVYSVLHHIPDYLEAIEEMGRVCTPGGVIFLDHEATENFWVGDTVYDQFKAEALRFDWQKYLIWSNYVARIRRIRNPRYTNEGDIHVWPDDHIEWSKIDRLLSDAGFDCVHSKDYLLSRKIYRQPVYDRYVEHCTDTRNRVYRRRICACASTS
jgi:ubiquinone/menaquinone biosynthesis C-methylase UbiE